MSKEIILTLLLSTSVHFIIWFQLNGQLVWVWCKDHPFLLSLLGVPISFLWINITELGYAGFGAIWPVRLIGFATGMVSFPIMTYFFLGEAITLRTAVSVVLAVLILLIQLK